MMKKNSVTQQERINVLGVHIDILGRIGLHEKISYYCDYDKKAVVAHANVHGLNIAYQLDWYRTFLNTSEIVFCDGFGVKWAARILGYRLPERITYADWTWSLAAYAEQHGYTLYFLGSRPGVAERAAQRLQERHPNLQIAGTNHGFFDKTCGSLENERVIHSINQAKPHILIVGFGMPLQERWLMDNWNRIEANVALPGGAVFDYVSGELRRGPRWMTDNGFEWLARLIIEPRRLWKRYVLGNPIFLWRVLRQRFGRIPRSLQE